MDESLYMKKMAAEEQKQNEPSNEPSEEEESSEESELLTPTESKDVQQRFAPLTQQQLDKYHETKYKWNFFSEKKKIFKKKNFFSGVLRNVKFVRF